MATPCAVCTRLDRATIDERLALQVCNVAALGREIGLPAKTLLRHRDRHIPQHLDAFKGAAQALTLDQLRAEGERLYRTSLDALARAEAGTLAKVEHEDKETGEVTVQWERTISHTSVARCIREARAGLTQLAALAGDRGDEKGRPSGDADKQLGVDIRAALERVMERSSPSLTRGKEDVLDVDVVDEVDQVSGDGAWDDADHPGGRSGQDRGTVPGVGDPLDRDAPPETPEALPSPVEIHTGTETPDSESLSPEQVRVAAASIGVTPESFLARMRQARQELVLHPEWKGNPAASEEERRAVGYGSIPVTDNRIDPDPRITPVQ